MKNSNIKTIYNRYEKSKIREQTKVREILQQAALLGLERHGFFEKAAFYGGTALRILYGLDRFSEDLDFTLLKPNLNFDFTPYLDGMKKELLSFGYDMEVYKKEKKTKTSILSAFMKINTIEYHLNIAEESKTQSINHNEKIQIKLEVDIDPPIFSRFENHLVLNPVTFYILTLHKSDLFAGKMHAILFRDWKGRIKGRDWYDLIWYIQNNIALSISTLQNCMKKAGHLGEKDLFDRDKLIELLTTRIQEIDWEDAKSDVRSFVSDPQKLNIWSSHFFLELIKHLQVE
ncbi:MAG: nucleotidyl transferase AbiEii/AbiGii toxin family protein [Parachlamydiales bacterium]|jgi:predicted nucleotidyltransferase component of viral defense system